MAASMMQGWVFDSLRYRVRKEERQCRAINPIRQEHAYGLVRRGLVGMSNRPVRWAGLYFALLILLSADIWLWGDLSYSRESIAWFNRTFVGTIHKFPVELAYFTTVWTVQTTLAGLVYPIVISFVALLLQRRYNAKAILHVYLVDSAAIPSGHGMPRRLGWSL